MGGRGISLGINPAFADVQVANTTSINGHAYYHIFCFFQSYHTSAWMIRHSRLLKRISTFDCPEHEKEFGAERRQKSFWVLFIYAFSLDEKQFLT